MAVCIIAGSSLNSMHKIWLHEIHSRMEERIEGGREREAFVVVEDAIEAPAPLSPPTNERCNRSLLLLLLLLLLILFLHRDSPPLSPSWPPRHAPPIPSSSLPLAPMRTYAVRTIRNPWSVASTSICLIFSLLAGTHTSYADSARRIDGQGEIESGP